MNLNRSILFFAPCLLFIFAFFFGVSLNWAATGLVESAVVAFLVVVTPRLLQTDQAKTRELFPIGMLVVFLFILTEAPIRSVSDTLFWTASGLLYFRSLLFLLRRLQATKNGVPPAIIIFIAGISIEFLITVIRIYRNFLNMGLLPAEGPLLYILSPALLIACIGWGWIRMRGPRWALLPGLVLSFFLPTRVAGMFITAVALGFETWVYLSKNEKQLS